MGRQDSRVPQGRLKPRIGEGRTASQRIVLAMDEQTHVKGFAWQEGYGAFTVGVSQKPRTVDYMKRQAEHHRNLSTIRNMCGGNEGAVHFTHPLRDAIACTQLPASKLAAVIGGPSGTRIWARTTEQYLDR